MPVNERDRQKILNMVSLAKRAGQLVLGFDLVKDTVMASRTDYVFVTQDLSPKSKKEVEYFCSQLDAQITVLPVSMEEIQWAVSKRSGVLTVCNPGMNKRLRVLCAQWNGEQAKGEGSSAK